MRRVFMGEFQHNLDEKARLTIPAKFREGLGDAFVATRGLDRCLFVYPRSDWDALAQRLHTLPLTRSDARQFTRFFLSGAAECELDKQGRVLLPANLREYAGVKDQCMVLGVGSRVEVWDATAWKQYAETAGAAFASIAEGLVDLDL
jgi:MraZ protein